MYKKVLIALVTAAALAGCASKGAHDATTPVDSGAAGSATSNTQTAPVQIGDSNDAANGVGLFDAKAKANIIYFAFDSSEIDAAGQATVGKFAKYLSANPTVKVRIEGNTDERGTREYNIGLGERRADAVKSALTAQGVSAGQLSVVSYGEERPAAQGHDEAAWSQNRRAVIIRQ